VAHTNAKNEKIKMMKRAALDAWANHIRVILAANVTTATAVRIMIPIAPIITRKFGFTIAATLSTGLAWQAYTLN
jgi:hypothetical protein